MGLSVHTIDIPNAANGFARQDRVIMGLISVAYGVGGGAGQVVTAALPAGINDLPSTTTFFVGDSADVTAFLTGTIATGMTLNIEPRLAANTVAAGTASILLVA